MKASLRSCAVFAALLASCPIAGCNAIVDTSTEQCRTDADCAGLGAGFEGTFCTPENVCGRLSCTSTRQCTERLGEPGYCRPDSTCTKVLTSECAEVVPKDALSEEEVILVGFMGPIKQSHPNESYGLPLRQGAEHALMEIESETNGLPGVEGGGQRHLAMLVCHDNENERAVARHLVHQVGVPAIIGPSFSGVTIRVTTDVTIPAGALALSPSATSPEITGLNDRGLVWRTAPSDEIQAEALALLLRETENALLLNEPVRVAYTVRDDSYGKGISESFIRKVLEFGIKSNAQVLDFRASSYDPEEVESNEAVTDAIAASLAQFGPHVVLGFGTNEFATKVLPKLEQRWDTPRFPERPRYLIPEGVRVTELVDAVEAQPDLSRRILGTAPGARQSGAFTGFAQTFFGRFGQTPGNMAEFAYDAAYLVAFATGISQRRLPTGGELALALESVSCKGQDMPVVVAGTSFNQSFNDAVTKQCIDFEGASGPLDFNNDTGEAPSDIALWCPEPKSGVFAPLETYYRASTRGLVGTLAVVDPWKEGTAICP